MVFSILKPQTLQDVFNLQVMDGMDSTLKSYIHSKLDQVIKQILDHTEAPLQENSYLTAISEQLDNIESAVKVAGDTENL